MNFDEVGVIRENDPSKSSSSDYLEESFDDFEESEHSLIDNVPDFPRQSEPVMATATSSAREGSQQHPYSDNEATHLLLRARYQFDNQSRESDLDSGYWSVNSTRGITVDIAGVNRTDHNYDESDIESENSSILDDVNEQLDITQTDKWPLPPTWL